MLAFLQFLGLRRRTVGVEPSLGTRLRGSVVVLVLLLGRHIVAMMNFEREILEYGPVACGAPSG